MEYRNETARTKVNNCNLLPGNKQSYTNGDLKEMQEWDLDHKISVSLTRILEFYNRFPDKIYVAFSGGKDSTVLLHLTRRLYPGTPALFIDTGLEYPEIREFVKTIDNVIFGYPCKWDRKKREYTRTSFREVIEENGYPVISKEVGDVIEAARRNVVTGKLTYRVERINGTALDKNGNKSRYNCNKWKYLLDAPFKISSKCCDIMKKAPSKKFARENGMCQIVGTMASESRLRKQEWLRNGCNIIDSKEPKSRPISFWTEQDILEYIKRYSLPYASVYGDIVQDKNGKYHTTGCQRTGCVFCGFGCHLEKEPNRFQRLKETHPGLWEYCMKPWEEGGLGMEEVLKFIGVKNG